MPYKNIQQKMNKEKFHQYCKEFFNLPTPEGEISFKNWVLLLGNVEWELNTGLEEPLLPITLEKEHLPEWFMSPDDNMWHHIRFIYDTVYIDGCEYIKAKNQIIVPTESVKRRKNEST